MKLNARMRGVMKSKPQTQQKPNNADDQKMPKQRPAMKMMRKKG